MKLNWFSSFISLALVPGLVVSPLWSQTPSSADAPADSAAAKILQLRAVEPEGGNVQANSRAARGFTVEVTDAAGAPVAEAAVAFRLPDDGATGVFADGTHSAVVYTDNAGRARVSDIQWGEIPGLAAIRVTATKGTSHALEQNVTANGATVASAAGLLPVPPSTTPQLTAPELDAQVRPTAPVQVQSAPPVPAQPASQQTLAKTMTQPEQSASITRPSSDPGLTPKPEPSVSISSASPGRSAHSSSKTKWIVIAAIAAGAGVGFAMAGRSKSSSSSAPAPSLSIGSPSISVGHP